MKQLYTIVILLCLLAIGLTVSGQPDVRPRLLHVNENYLHAATHFNFPDTLFGNFRRQDVYSFDKQEHSIGVTYENFCGRTKTVFSIYLYPAGMAFEGRLRHEYQTSMQAVVNHTETELHARQYIFPYESKKYICNGIAALIKTDKHELAQMTLFEAGTWFYKIMITSDRADTVLLSDLRTKILQAFEPTELTDLVPLHKRISVYMQKSAFRDSVLLGSAMASAYRKIDWVMDNVERNVRATGFPDLYLNLHVAGLKAFMEFQHRENVAQSGQAWYRSPFTENYLRQLQLISNAGFLEEFVMDQYDMLLIIPKEITVQKYNDYLRWKSQHDIGIDLDDTFYILSFDTK